MPGDSPVTLSENAPRLMPGSKTTWALPSLSVGLGSLAVGAYSTPRWVMGAPPVLLTVPPRTADVAMSDVAVGLVTVGTIGIVAAMMATWTGAPTLLTPSTVTRASSSVPAVKPPGTPTVRLVVVTAVGWTGPPMTTPLL